MAFGLHTYDDSLNEDLRIPEKYDKVKNKTLRKLLRDPKRIESPTYSASTSPSISPSVSTSTSPSISPSTSVSLSSNISYIIKPFASFAKSYVNQNSP